MNNPIECANPDCGQLYCTHCLNMKCYDKNLESNERECEVCKHSSKRYRNPSAIVLKMLSKYRVSCLTCGRDFSVKDIAQHEVMC